MTSNDLNQRINLGKQLPAAYKELLAMHQSVTRAAVDAGIDPQLIELVKIRASQLNGCAFCLDMHSRDARQLGETERRLFVLAAWRETDLYTEQERAALALTEAMTNLPIDRDVPDEVYQQAAKAFSNEQLAVVAWAVTVINTFNRLGVFSRLALPADPA
ncbi:MAG TPA: carboxymuconolactone decarboxylase family protein [Pseudonocardiaceae bacterium]|jgi:AhpD family alkylhydroperoxidase|nr:carboxymuconolactone decarboxylase family protein [Pseudonocardiaceae bacterium]